ncbi:hypothetical protein HMPREF1624_02844 [Sporothrix schenckii ATCC 58251]|uniref:Inner centromere protein ARK-binding domain-containing protein n=1 Tax=Sporothrix schenckii (strain ATCC 58251 / de Perez 2211183) TaxID=1391915 RepID=U7Q159_SPOS1|nr:hypothetical protein HMPREF1624_02844 [Sporothrix schenckii ATCC 58251]
MAMRGPRHPIGAAPWIAEERTTALHIAQSEVDEFMFSAKNELDWLNEHMAEIFSENQINVADIFKTPGKLRGKTPRTARKANKADIRAPLTDVFSSTPKGAPNPFAVSKLTSIQQQQRRQSPTFTVAEDKPAPPRKSPSPSPQRVVPAKTAAAATAKAKTVAASSQNTKKATSRTVAPVAAKPTKAASSLIDSGYHGSQSQDVAFGYDDDEDELAGDDMSTQPFSQPTRPVTPEVIVRKPVPAKVLDKQKGAATTTTAAASAADLAMSPDVMADHPSPTQPTVEPTFHSAKEEQTAVMAPAAPPADKPGSPSPDTEVLSSSPFCPVESPSSARPTKAASPVKAPTVASPTRKPVPAPSSPLQSTTPACPPPRELLSAMGASAPTASVASPAQAFVNVPPAVPTPPMASVPAFIAEKRAAIASSWQYKEVVGKEVEDVVVYEEEAHDDMVEDNAVAEEGVLQPRKEQEQEREQEQEQEQDEEEVKEETAARSPSDPSSPVRPMVRKSSMNFASLPARAPFTSNKSLGGAGAGLARVDQSRTSYYNRPTGGKSIGNVRMENDDDQDDERNAGVNNEASGEKDMAAHNKTYAQRLHDRISMLGKSQANAPRPSKSLAALAHHQETKAQQQKSLSPKRTATSVAAPGAFPEDEEDDDDDWIVPPANAVAASTSPAKSHAMVPSPTTEGADTPGAQTEFVLPKQRLQDVSRPASPKKVQAPIIPERTTSTVTGHMKSVSVPSLPVSDSSALTTTKPISVSNPANAAHVVLGALSELQDRPPSPSKSPSRNYRDSPLKHVKNKLSSILKTSKGLLASSAALSAEGKSSLLSPSSTRLGLLMGPSTDSLTFKSRNDSTADLARPDLSRQTSATTTVSTTSASAASAPSDVPSNQESPARPEKSPVRSESPTRPRKTRASTERERREMKHREKELKEVQRMAEQMGKLEKMREKEREKARVFVEEQEKAAATVENPAQTPAQRELRGHKQAQPQQQPKSLPQSVADRDDDMDELSQQPPPKPKPESSSPSRVAAKPTRTSPRKAKQQQADNDVDMTDAPASMLPPAPPAHNTVTANSSVPRSAQSTRAIRRPIKPTKDAPAKTKQAPTVIRVNTSSSQQHQQQSSQFHPSNSILAASLHETLVGPPQLKNKASTASLHTKPSLQSLKSSVSSTGRPKALELAAKRKEVEEREAQRKRDAKAEIERKRAALQEQEEQRKQELQKQREREREREQAAAEAAAAKKRQAAIEKAKQTRAPPPVQRTQLPSGPSTDYGRSEAQPPRPQSRLATATGTSMHRSQEEQHRPVNAVLSHTGKAMSKRPLPGTDTYESQNHGRPGTAGGNGGGGNMPSYQHKDAKRIRMSEEFDEDELEMGGHAVRVSSIKGPPIRPSQGFKKDLPNKPVFGNGYSTAQTNVSRDLFKSTVTAQHNYQTKTAHPMDMAQVSKAAISFAPSGNGATSAAAAVAVAAASQGTHKTPLRPAGAPQAGKSTAKSAAKSVGKSAAKSSPRFPNGDAIELPDIQTDDEDSEEEVVNAAPWADSPDLRRALMRQETVDPVQVFGPPGPLNMEEVFNKSKDRWHKFRARGSSANWSGIDRLTEDDIRKDLAARDKIRREGGWSYELGKDML